MNESEKRAFFENEIKATALHLLKQAVSADYAEELYALIGDDVIDDVLTCSGIEDDQCFSDSDVRFAIGRTLIDKLQKIKKLQPMAPVAKRDDCYIDYYCPTCNAALITQRKFCTECGQKLKPWSFGKEKAEG